MFNRIIEKKLAIALFAALLLSSIGGANENNRRLVADSSMFSLFVTIRMQAEHMESVVKATLDIAKASVAEPGCFRYDVLRDSDDPAILYLFEVFRDRESHSEHTETAHFNEWVKTAAHLLDGEMTIVTMDTMFPTANGYEAQKSGLIFW